MNPQNRRRWVVPTNGNSNRPVTVPDHPMEGFAGLIYLLVKGFGQFISWLRRHPVWLVVLPALILIKLIYWLISNQDRILRSVRSDINAQMPHGPWPQWLAVVLYVGIWLVALALVAMFINWLIRRRRRDRTTASSTDGAATRTRTAIAGTPFVMHSLEALEGLLWLALGGYVIVWILSVLLDGRPSIWPGVFLLAGIVVVTAVMQVKYGNQVKPDHNAIKSLLYVAMFLACVWWVGNYIMTYVNKYN